MEFFLTALFQGIGFSALGIGVFLSLRIFNIPDITTDGSYTLGGVITAVCLTKNLDPATTMLLSIGGGMLAGMITGIIHTRFKANALLSGILVMTALYSVNLVIMGRSNLPLINVKDLFFYAPFPERWMQVAMMLLLIIGTLYFVITRLLKTDFGIAMRATGNSEIMVRAMGVNTERMKITGLAIANGCTALSGCLLTQYQGFADINMGIGIVISGLASVMIGETLRRKWISRYIALHVLAICIGSIVFRLILAAVLSVGLDPNYLRLVTAVLVLLIIVSGNLRVQKSK
jgi:putative ABC transport system permease protein